MHSPHRPENDLHSQSLAEIYNSSAAHYRKTFPEKLANLYITLGFDEVYASPDIGAHLTQNISSVREMVSGRLALMKKLNIDAAVGANSVGGKEVRYLSMLDAPDTSFVSALFPPAMNQIAIFDHEMGHIVVPNGSQGKPAHLSECAADAYAALRHLQRFGTATDILGHAPYMAAESALFEPFPLHYTSAVFQKIARIRQEGEIDIQALSLQETAALAGKIAIDYAYSDITLGKIHSAYARARAAEREERSDWARVVCCVAAAMLEHRHDDDIYRAGKLYLGRPEIKRLIGTKLADHAQFQSALAAMARHEKDSGFIPDAAAAIDKKRAAGVMNKTRAAGAAQKAFQPQGGAP